MHHFSLIAGFVMTALGAVGWFLAVLQEHNFHLEEMVPHVFNHSHERKAA